MTEKRFTAQPETVSYKDNLTGEIYRPKYEMEFYKLLDKLNELAEEKENITLLAQHNYEESKRIINRYVDKIKELEKENKELKEEIKGFESCSHNWGLLYDEAKNKVEELSKENKELKMKYDAQRLLFGQLNSDYNNLREENKELKQLNIPIEEIEETVIDYQGRITAIYYKE